ncbi:acyl-coenzyme A amino acid N-acyltransferase 1 [Octopus bimaculoides]|uniref:BAAT/Acyl-CoA thioester hydrolase C-terminal domain-containing protein n=1 Tax=Octopus bimaculoides TaxID=37653 RepID=A0A0L8H095_OCTBM|nr:acyl-coenzyme A amino acid N-acyltransferase 1 [Octopus bimaculoides]|eukprot:XP_014776508.1 PREDICTED: acyl-coenzyme A amino acid N-acyltransferase 1-like [Octopus bimaculoides]
MILHPSYQLLSALRHTPSYPTVLPRVLVSTRCPVSVTVNPENGLVDEQLSVSVSGLKPEENVTVSATMEQSSKKRESVFRSFGHFKTSVDGCVNLVTDPCLAGTYTGIDPMGLFWSMTQVVGKHGRINTDDATKSLDCTVMVHPGHISQHSEFTSDIKPLATKLVQRSFMRSGVRKITVNHGRLRGSLFIPSDETSNRQRRRYPAVIDLFGSTGSLIESRGALLASHGFIALSLAYFAYKDLPSVVTEVDFEYFEEAIEWLINHEQVSSENGIGVLGLSLGGVIAVYMAKECPQVSAVISINGLPNFFIFGIRHNGKQVPYHSSMVYGLTVMKDDGFISTNWKIEESKSFYLDESSRSKVLLLVGGDDNLYHTCDYYLWHNNLTPAKRKDVELIIYEGAGHVLEPPYTPLFNSIYHPKMGQTFIYGGYPQQHAEAQEKSWLKIKEFFTENL